jgi:hypothetical protein
MLVNRKCSRAFRELLINPSQAAPNKGEGSQPRVPLLNHRKEARHAMSLGLLRCPASGAVSAPVPGNVAGTFDLAERLLCSEQSLRLLHLQHWVRVQRDLSR